MGGFLDFLTALLTPRRTKARAVKVPVPAPASAPAAPPPRPETPALPPTFQPPQAPPRIVAGETVVIVPPKGTELPPFVPIIDKIPIVGSILTAPIKLGTAIFGDPVGDITNFDPWNNPENPSGAFYLGPVLRAIDAIMRKYDVGQGRFLNADGTVAAIDPRFTDSTGQMLPEWRTKYDGWALQHFAAIRFNYDRSKVGADGYTPLPPVQLPVYVDSPAEKAAVLDAALAAGLPPPNVVVAVGVPPIFRQFHGLIP